MSNGDNRDRLVVVTQDDGSIVDLRTGAVLNAPPRRKTWGEQITELNARKAAGSKPVAKVVEPDRPEIDPLTHDTSFVVVPRELMNRLMNKAGVSKEEIELRIDEEIGQMNDRQWVKYFCARSTEAAPIWVLISMVARKGDRVGAFKAAQMQFRAEAETNKAKAACVHWADKLRLSVVLLLESGDFQRPEEVAFHLIEQAKKENRPGFVQQMLADFTSVRLVPVASLYPAVATNAELGDRKVDVLPPAADEDVEDPPTVETPAIVPVLSKEERIEAMATELAKAAGKDYKSAVSAIRGYYRKEAKRKLGS